MKGLGLPKDARDRLAENMVVSVEPGIYLKGFGGIRHSDTVLVTKNGYELLTHIRTEQNSLVIKKWKPLKRCKGRLLRWSLNVKSPQA